MSETRARKAAATPPTGGPPKTGGASPPGGGDLERRIIRIYREAQKDLEKKLETFVKKKEARNQEKLKQLKDEKITLEEYQSWMRGQVFQENQWRAKVEEATEVLLHSNEKALSIIRDEQMAVFADNANHQAYDVERKTGFEPGINLDIYDIKTVDRLIKEKPELMPRKIVDGRKDKAWNQGNIANVITQGIIQGEGIRSIAKRMARDTASTNLKAMTRYARTAMTNAQNAGRLEVMERAQDMGINVKKQWLATLDSRTRDSHREMDGVTVGIKEKFTTPLGSKMMFPGDMAGKAGDVWNCRCTMVYVYPDFKEQNAKRYDQETGKVIDDITYKEWYKQKRTAKASGASRKTEQWTNNLDRVGQKKNIESEEEKLQAIKQIKNINDEEAERIAKALYGYHGDPESCWCDGRDSAIRSEATKNDAEDARLLQKLVDNSPKFDGTIFRGMGVNQETLEALQVGTKFSEEKYALSSWSSREDVARRYASRSADENGKTRVVFEIENHTHGAPIAHISLYETEQEVLVNNKNVQYVITDKKQVDIKGRKFIWIKLAEAEK